MRKLVTSNLVPALLLAALTVQPAMGASILVNTTADAIADDGQCSLREAIIAANTDTASGALPGECPAGSGNDIITLPAGTHMLTGGSMFVVETVDINGVGPASTIIDGGGIDRFFVTNTGTLTLTGLTLQNGNINTNAGGAIDNCCRTVVLTDCIITGNSASGGGALAGSNGTWILTRVDLTGNDATCCAGGAIQGGGNWTLTDVTIDSNTAGLWGGGIFGGGSWTLTDVTISNNSALLDGGAIRAGGGAWTLTNVVIDSNTAGENGGGIWNGTGSWTLTNTTISNNRASGNFIGGGIHSDSGAWTIRDSTISGNSAFEGGGIDHRGPGGAWTIRNSTISGNDADNSGGDGGGIFASDGNWSVINSTVVDNDSGGIYLEGVSVLNLTNTIVANNLSKTDCTGSPPGSNGNNVDSDGSCGLTEPGDLPGTNPLLGPLTNNGGPTLTHALLAGSPAIDSAINGLCPPADQRGIARPQGPNCDIGAFEAGVGSALPGDGNGDGIVNAVDLVICVEALETNYLAACDTDGDGDLDLDDVVEIVVQAFLPASH